MTIHRCVGESLASTTSKDCDRLEIHDAQQSAVDEMGGWSTEYSLVVVHNVELNPTLTYIDPNPLKLGVYSSITLVIVEAKGDSDEGRPRCD